MIKVVVPQADTVTLDRERHFERVMLRHSRRLFRLAFSILGDSGEAEDAVQETMIRAWKAWERTVAHEDQGPWLTRICVNHCISRRHRLGRLFPLLNPAVQREALPHQTGDPDLERGYTRLSAHQRAVVVLHYHYGYSLDECAGLLGCRPGTARSHLARALARLRQEVAHA